MVDVRVSRMSGVVFAQAESIVAIGRVDVEVAGLAGEASTVAVARVSRLSGEVFGRAATTVNITRADVEVAGLAQAPNTTALTLVSRLSGEVFANVSPKINITRADVEVAGLAQAANATALAKVSRLSSESFARRGSAGAVVPLALSGNDDELFLHDWADECALTSSYLTDVTVAATGAEARRGLRLKPARSMDVVWRQSNEEFDADDFSRLDRLYVYLRRLTSQRMAVPLFPDMRTLDAAYASNVDTLAFDTSRGRWFVGARVAVVLLSTSGSYSSHTFHLIETLTDSQITLTANLGVAVPAGSIVVPMMDCEIVLEVDMKHETGCLAEVTLTVDEIPGASQLPATKADTPNNVPTHLGAPILDVDPDWSDGVRRGRSRQGREIRSGRARGVAVEGSRSRERHDLTFVNGRACGDEPAKQDAWKLVEFFDTRRGRLRSFWHVDHQYIWTAAVLSTGSVQIDPFGDIDDFREELVGGQIGIVMSDGTFYVRDVSAVNDGVTWEVLISPVLPSGLDPTAVTRVARARRVRFDSDEMEESWTNAGLVETKLKIIEVLEEKDVAL